MKLLPAVQGIRFNDVHSEYILTRNRNYNETWNGNADIDSVALYNLVDDPKEELNLAKNDTMAEKATKLKWRRKVF